MTEVIVISDTIQEFLGERYYLCGRYFQKKGVRLHRKVWEYHNGPAPEDYDVHHHTEDRSRNQIEDLELKVRQKHHQDHNRERPQETKDRFAAAGRPGAAEWHGSEEGRQWHSDHYEKNLRHIHAEKVTKTCEECGSSYETPKNRASVSRFCRQSCKQRARRKRLRSGISCPGATGRSNRCKPDPA